MTRFLTMTLAVLTLAAPCVATQVDIGAGQTSVLLDTATLEAAASLTLSGVSPDVIAPGNLGAASVAFGINPRDAATLPTTFEFDSDNFLGTFSGSIEHQGSVFFNANTVEVGDFSIRFDAARAGTLGGAASGFYVESNVGIAAILFDVAAPSALDVDSQGVDIGADLLVSPEFGSFLFSNGLSTSNLAGADVGDAFVEARAIPEPASWLLGGLALIGLALRGRRFVA